ncbi:MAG TPA: GNAT family N-acetyltransferase [Caulobacter sp.]|nr:GNAT family N-acetyltransferase [Caulobacter sp.]
MPEAAALAAVHAQAFDHGWSSAEIAALLDSPGTFAIAEDQGFVLARVAAGEAEIITLAVAPAARRQGLATRLMEEAIVRAIALGAETMFLEVADDNHAALRLYSGLGFELAGRRVGYYRRPGLPPVDALVMRLSLNR